MVRGEHEEVLDTLDGLDADSIILLVDELVHKVEDEGSSSHGLLDIWAEDSDDSIDILTDYLVGRKVAADVDIVELTTIRLVGFCHVHLEEQAEGAGDERCVCKTRCVDDASESA